MFIHSEDTVVTIDDNDITDFITSSTFNRTSDVHDVTTYGKSSKVYKRGLKDATVELEFIYDTTVSTGLVETMQPLYEAGTEVELVWQPAGTGTGLPQCVCNVIVKDWNATSPVADMVKATASLQVSGDVVITAQSS